MPTYEVWVRAEGAEEKKAVAGDNTPKTYGEKTAASLEKGIKGLVSYAAVKTTAEQLITAEIGRVELRTGASEYQQRIQTVYSIGSSIVNSGVTIGIGAATGNLPLVLISAVTNGLKWVSNVIQKEITLGLEESRENISIGLATRRAGTNGRRQ